jgi:hypothetical protein
VHERDVSSHTLQHTYPSAFQRPPVRPNIPHPTRHNPSRQTSSPSTSPHSPPPFHTCHRTIREKGARARRDAVSRPAVSRIARNRFLQGCLCPPALHRTPSQVEVLAGTAGSMRRHARTHATSSPFQHTNKRTRLSCVEGAAATWPSIVVLPQSISFKLTRVREQSLQLLDGGGKHAAMRDLGQCVCPHQHSLVLL